MESKKFFLLRNLKYKQSEKRLAARHVATTEYFFYVRADVLSVTKQLRGVLSSGTLEEMKGMHEK